MRIGLVYPQTEYPTDPGAVNLYAHTAEQLGFTHILAYDHVLGANPERPGGWQGPYTFRHTFQEPLMLFSFMAGITQHIEFATGVIILPQRQTALFAKQVANLDVFSGGRLRVGIGLGWNEVEYQALGQNFHDRGKRSEEQVAVLRQLWSQPLVTFQGRWHTVSDAGLNPLPVQQPIPLWFGGHAPAALERAARLGDGWMTNYRTAADARPALEQLDGYLRAAGRSRENFGIEARMSYGDGDPEVWTRTMRDWQAAGATHLSFNTMGHGFDSIDKHMAAIRLFADVVRSLK